MGRKGQQTKGKEKAKKTKEKGGSSRDDPLPARPEPGDEPTTTILPWPRHEGEDCKPFIDHYIPLAPEMTYARFNDREYRTRRYGSSWQHYNSVCYNGFHHIKLLPSRVICPWTLRMMGIEKDVHNMLRDIGLGTMAEKEYDLHPDAVRQFLASCELTYEDMNHRVASEGTLSFLYRGQLYETTIRQLCRIYGFDPDFQEVKFHDANVSALWDLIGTVGEGPSKNAKLTKIRNPVLRVVAKIIGATLFAKEETGAITAPELYMLHAVLPRFTDSCYRSGVPPRNFRVNFGAIFAAHLVQKKLRAIDVSKSKTETIGSLLTPIFIHHRIDLSRDGDVITAKAHFDEQYFKLATYFRPQWHWRFIDRDGEDRVIKLAQPDLTTITSLANVEFLPPLDVAPYDPAVRRRRGGSSQDPQPHLEDDLVFDTDSQQPAEFLAPMEFLLPEYTGQHDPPALATDASDRECMDWLIESQRETHSMMQMIWGALAKIPRPRVPSCLRPPPTRSPVRETGAPSRQEDVQMADDADADADDDSVLRRRPRRALGHSRSTSPEERETV